MKPVTSIKLQTDFQAVSIAQSLMLQTKVLAQMRSRFKIVPDFEQGRKSLRPDWVQARNCYHYALGADLESLRHPDEIAIESLSPGEIWLRREYLGREDFPEIHAAFQSQIWAAAEGEFADFAEYIVNGALVDGIVPVGHHYQPRADGFPVALFLSKAGEGHAERDLHDHHWYSLWQVSGEGLQWCSKFVEQKPKVISGESIFDDAHRAGYAHFAGYFHRPADLDAA